MTDKKRKVPATQSSFTALLVEVKDRIQSAQIQAVLFISNRVKNDLLHQYWC